jgi:hypothetical protein
MSMVATLEERIGILCTQLASSQDKSQTQEIAAELAHVIAVKARLTRTQQEIEAMISRIPKC